MKINWTKVWKVIKTIGLAIWGIYTAYATYEWKYNYKENWKEFKEKINQDMYISNIRCICGLRYIHGDKNCLDAIEDELERYDELCEG